jgi:hypothetical protein
MVNADSPGRFAKRHILNSFTWKNNKPRLDLNHNKALLTGCFFYVQKIKYHIGIF